LTNIARHAQVDEATVRISTHQQTLLIEVEDLGNGFDVEATLAASETCGLSGMRERAVLLGGLLTVESQPGVGTRLLAELSIADSPIPLRVFNPGSEGPEHESNVGRGEDYNRSR
jgi:signal transduction histidine kinase